MIRPLYLAAGLALVGCDEGATVTPVDAGATADAASGADASGSVDQGSPPDQSSQPTLRGHLRWTRGGRVLAPVPATDGARRLTGRLTPTTEIR